MKAPEKIYLSNYSSSEDEKIRKGLIGYFMYLKSIDKNVLSDITNDNILSWLESIKQRTGG